LIHDENCRGGLRTSLSDSKNASWPLRCFENFLERASQVVTMNKTNVLRELFNVPARIVIAVLAASTIALSLRQVAIHASDTQPLLTGRNAYGDWRDDAPGVRRKITVAGLPPPFATNSNATGSDIIPRPADAELKVPPGFSADEFAGGLDHPREIRAAPNGDLFISESYVGRIRVLRTPDGATKPRSETIFASGLNLPFGIAFWPSGPNPRYVYIANTGSIVRFPYHIGDVTASGPAETIVADIPAGGHLRGGGHWTRDVVFSQDGSHMFVSVGSHTNDAQQEVSHGPPGNQFQKLSSNGKSIAAIAQSETAAEFPMERDRADVLEFNPDGTGFRIFASGLRNCVGMAINPISGRLWCSTNERDGLGDNLPPDYITSVQFGSFYGWPWFYIGGHKDPYHGGEHPELRDKVIVPDVLLQPHSASLEMVFYEGTQFPSEYKGDAFAAEHGSWNRALRTGYKVIRVIMRNGKPTGEYDDFMTGFVTNSGDVWGRPVGVAVGHDGSLFVTEDANGTVWRISYHGPHSG
jgi:glucose/arabinose dehydrogenase